ncbi:MAG: hypothetical protein IT342_13865 [Candidatus Melainabacteria bacterium]|nr:hypothetical protein [Candidatus Melainabacteria bacterium]
MELKPQPSLDMTNPTCKVEDIITGVVAACFRRGGLSVAELNASFAGASGVEFKGMQPVSMRREMIADADEMDRLYASAVV